MGEEVEEDGGDKRENFPLIRHAISKQPIAQVVLDDVAELFPLKEARLGLLKNRQDEFEADDLRPDHVIAELFLPI